MADNGDEVASFSLPVERRSGDPSPSAQAIDCLAGRLHKGVLQESAEFLRLEAMTRQFHAAHFRGCATRIKYILDQILMSIISTCKPTRHSEAGGPSRLLSKARVRRMFSEGQVKFHGHVIALPQRGGKDTQCCGKLKACCWNCIGTGRRRSGFRSDLGATRVLFLWALTEFPDRAGHTKTRWILKSIVKS